MYKKLIQLPLVVCDQREKIGKETVTEGEEGEGRFSKMKG